MLLDAGQIRMRSRLLSRAASASPSPCAPSDRLRPMRASKARIEQAPELSGRFAFFLDLDGTLLDITDHPHHVSVDAGLVHLLKTLGRAAGGALALISGRPIADIDRLLPHSAFCVAGQHGAERRDFSGTMHRHDVRAPPWTWRDGSSAMMAAKHPSLVLEDKGVNLALHFRAAPELRAEIQDAVRGLARELGGEFEVQLGKMVRRTQTHAERTRAWPSRSFSPKRRSAGAHQSSSATI